MADESRSDSYGPGDSASIQRDHQLILDARGKGRLATLGAYTRLSGPGWLQSAITLGGATLTGSLYLGVLTGTALLWLQPLAMILGIVMLSAIAYVSLSVKERPFQAINNHVNPVLGWGWLIATLMANLVWSLPTFGVATAAVRQNLLPGVVGQGAMPDTLGNLLTVSVLVLIAVAVVWFYGGGRTGIKIFEIILKLMVGVIVFCFFGVVVKLILTGGGLDWKGVLGGLIPDPRLLSSPADSIAPYVADVDPRFQDFWNDHIVGQQRNVMVTAAAAAVGINMTVLLPYSMLQRGWNRDFRGLATFDLSTGLFIPYVLTTCCVVIAAAMQFHTRPVPGLLAGTDRAGTVVQAPENLVARYKQEAEARIRYELGDDVFAGLSDERKAEKRDALIEALPAADKRMAAMIVKRDSFDLAQSLAQFTGKNVAHYVFGIGVVGMALSSGLLLMLINGFVVCEMLGRPARGLLYRIGTLMPCVGLLGPFIMGTKQAQFWLMIPTSIFAMVVLPIAYVTFLLLMNQKSLLGNDMPRGVKRVLWNVLMAIAAGLAAFLSFWSIWSNAKIRWYGLGAMAAFVALALIVHFVRTGRSPTSSATGS